METRHKSQRRPSTPLDQIKRKPNERKKNDVNSSTLTPVEEENIQLRKRTAKKKQQNDVPVVLFPADKTTSLEKSSKEVATQSSAETAKQLSEKTAKTTLNDNAGAELSGETIRRSTRNRRITPIYTEEPLTQKVSHSITKTLSKKKKKKKKALYHPGGSNSSKSYALKRQSNFLIPKASFKNLAQEVFSELLQDTPIKFHLSSSAVECLQACSEELIVEMFKTTQLIATNSKRTTILRRDFLLARRIRGMESLRFI